MCVCVFERERERDSMYVSVFMGACVCFKEGEREIVCMCVW